MEERQVTAEEAGAALRGETHAATWDGTTLAFVGRAIRNGKPLDIDMSMTLVGDRITGGTGAWSDADAGCGGTETYTGNLRTDVLWDGQLPAGGGACWPWQP